MFVLTTDRGYGAVEFGFPGGAVMSFLNYVFPNPSPQSDRDKVLHVLRTYGAKSESSIVDLTRLGLVKAKLAIEALKADGLIQQTGLLYELKRGANGAEN